MRERFFEAIQSLKEIICDKNFYSRFSGSRRDALSFLNEEVKSILRKKNIVAEGYFQDTDTDFLRRFDKDFKPSVQKLLKALPLLYHASRQLAVESYYLNKIRTLEDNLKTLLETIQINRYSKISI